MYVKQGAAIDFMAFFSSSRIGKPAITVTVDVYEWRSGAIVKARNSDPAVEIGGGLYGIRHTMIADATAVAIFKTNDMTVDVQHIPAMALDPAKEGTVSVFADRLTDARAAKIDSIWTEVDLNLDAKVSEVPELVSGTIAGLNGAEIAAAVVEELYQTLAATDSIVMGQGIGSVTFNTKLEAFEDHKVMTSGNRPIQGVVVRAFAADVAGNVDWDSVIARHVTDINGDFTLYLDPGEYVISYEKNGVQINTGTLTVDEPTP